MGQLRDKVIIQSRTYLDPNQPPIPSYDYDLTYPVTVYEAIKSSMEDDAHSLCDELESIYRLIDDKQNIIPGGVAGDIMTWSGIDGQIGSLNVSKSIPSADADRSSRRIPTEKAVGTALDQKVSRESFREHADNNSIHITDIERNRWDSMAPKSTLQAHIGNTSVHITANERKSWNEKAKQEDLDKHIYNTNNPHSVTAHQVGSYTRHEIDDMFANLRESFFNYINISWDERNGQASLVDYHPSNWNPNFILDFADQLPDIPDPALTYFALRPATDPETDESQDCIIYVKRPGLIWEEAGFCTMNLGDMVILYPDTQMFVWMEGHFIRLFKDSSSGVVAAESDMLWRPSINAEGKLVWTKSKETVPPDPMDIKGKDGYTPIKGVDYVDGKDGQGVPIGGNAGAILVKVTDENYDTTWKSLVDAFADLVVQGVSLPEGIIKWDSILNRPVWYNELGDHDDGFITQQAASRQFDVVKEESEKLTERVVELEASVDDFNDHVNNFNNPHRVTATSIGAVPTVTYMTHVQNYNNPHSVTAAQIGLGNVDNTHDIDKPISNPTQAALDVLTDRINMISNGVDESNYIASVEWTDASDALRFIYKDGTILELGVPITEIFETIRFDEAEHELVITLPDGSENRVDISSLIKLYTGSIGENIQVVVENDNIIKASIIPGTVGELEIAQSVHLRGSPTTTTQPVSDKSTRIATTEFVRDQVIDSLISYEPDRPLSANMGRILNQRKVDVDDIIEILNDIEGIDVIDNLTSTNPAAALSANMGRVLDLEKAPRIHTSPSGSTFGRATISLFGHARASDVDPLMDGTVSRGTDDGYFARGNHRHPTDTSRAPMHWPDVAHNQYELTGEPRAAKAPDDSNDNRIATTEWVRQNAVGVTEGTCETIGDVSTKVVVLRSDYMENPVFMRQTGSTVTVKFTHDDTSSGDPLMNVHGSGDAPIHFGGKNIVNGMLKANHEYLFTFDGEFWNLMNPSGIHTLPDSDNSNAFVSSEWIRRNVVGVSQGESDSPSDNAAKTARLRSTYMDPVVFIRQIGSAVAITFGNTDLSGAAQTTLDVNGSGASPIMYSGKPVENGMLKANHTHLFVFDGNSWNLMNPAPGTGFGGVTFNSQSSGNPASATNVLSGHMGFTIEGYGGTANGNGYVNRLIVTIKFPYHDHGARFTISSGTNDWAARMGDGSIINLTNPSVLVTNKDNAVVQFTMGTSYPSNSPCMLVYRNSGASYSVQPK